MPRRKSSNLEGLFYILLGVAALFAYIIQLIFEMLAAIAPLLFIGLGAFVIYKLYVLYYFQSKNFKRLKEKILTHTQNCNLKTSPKTATVKSSNLGKQYEKIEIHREPDCEHTGLA